MMYLPISLVFLSIFGVVNAKPTLQDNSILPYVPNAIAAFVFGAVYATLGVIFFFHVFRTRSWWALCLPIGVIVSSAGYFLRLVLRQDQNQHSLGLFIPMDLAIIVSPCAFLAFNYLVYGHLIVAVDGSLGAMKGRKAKSYYSYIPPRLVKHVFVWSDVITLLIQTFGGSMEASKKTEKVGSKIVMIGIILQLASYIFFVFVVTIAHRRLIERPADTTFSEGGWWSHPTKRLFTVLYYTSIFICIRNTYRTVELALGYEGYLWTHEVFFLTMDAVPLTLALGIYVFIWPSTLLDRTQALASATYAQKYSPPMSEL